MSTKDNLAAAFAGESQANRRYLFAAEKADAEGHAQVARLFRAAAAAETVHAGNHLKALDAIGSTAENLKGAVAGESHEFNVMYPGFIAEAEAEGDQKALRSFKYANEVEKIHYALYQQALASLEGGETLKEETYYVCPVCGYTHGGNPPEKCPVCGAAGSKFQKID
jgi:rubrerythrin